MNKKTLDKSKKLILFQSRKIRRTWYKAEWYYSLVDVVAALTDSTNPTDYFKKVRKRDEELGDYIGTNCPQVEMKTSTGKKKENTIGKCKRYIPDNSIHPFKESRTLQTLVGTSGTRPTG